MNKTMPKCNRYRVLPATDHHAWCRRGDSGRYQIDGLALCCDKYNFQVVGDCETKQYARNAGVAQLVEHELPKLGVAGSNPVARSSIRHMSFHVAQMSMTNSPPAERKGQLLVILLSHKRRQCLLRLKKVNIISGAHAGKVRNNHFAMAVTKTPE